MTPREVIAEWFARNRGAARVPPGQRDDSPRRAAGIIAALAAAGYSIVGDGQARIDGEVVGLESVTSQEMVVHHAPGFADDGIASIGDVRAWRHEPIPPEQGINGHVGTWTTVHPMFYAVPLTTHDEVETDPPPRESAPSKVVDLMDALEASVNKAKAARKRSRTIDERADDDR